MKRKLLSFVLAFTMTVGLFTVDASAAVPTYGDTKGHWAESSIDRWSRAEVVQGSNGEFLPDGELTCAQLATILTKLLALPAAQSAGFTDNDPTAWYSDAINRCAAAGILKGNGDGTVSPDATISRERAMVMLGRALGVEPIENPDLTKYTDAAQVAPYAQGMVAALVEAGIVGGVTSDTLAPQSEINRASTVTILDRAIGTYANTDGETVNVSESKGITLIVANNVTVTGKVDTLIVASSENSVKLDGATVEKVSVTGEGSTVVLNNAEVKTVVASGTKAAVETTGTTKVETLTVTGTNASVTTADNTTVGTLEVSAENASVTTEGKTTVETLAVSGTNTAVETKGSTKIETVAVSEEATGTTVTTGSGTTVSKVENKAEGTTVTGSGTVETVESSKDVAVETKGTKVENTGDTEITMTDSTGNESSVSGGSSTASGSTSSSSSDRDSHSHSYSSEWSHDADYHWHAATCGHDVKGSEATHTWNEGEVTTAPTCVKEGVKTFTCTVCGMKKTETISATGGHTYNADHYCAGCGTFDGDTYAAIDTTGYTSVQAAIDAVTTDGVTVKLLKDSNEDVKINGKKDLTLDFNGNTISGSVYIGCTTTDGIWDETGETSTLTLKDSGGENKGGVKTANSTAIYLENKSELTIESGTYENTPTSSGGRTKTILMGGCKLTVQGGYIHNNAPGGYNYVIVVDNYIAKTWGDPASVTINGGKIEGSAAGSYNYLISSYNSEDVFDVTINGGEFISHGSYSYLTNIYGNVVINDCSFVAENYWEAFYMSTSDCSVTVKGGTFALNGTYEREPGLAGLVFHRKSPEFWTSTSGKLLVDPAESKTVKVNQATDSNFIASGAEQTGPVNGWYTIAKKTNTNDPRDDEVNTGDASNEESTVDTVEQGDPED